MHFSETEKYSGGYIFAQFGIRKLLIQNDVNTWLPLYFCWILISALKNINTFGCIEQLREILLEIQRLLKVMLIFSKNFWNFLNCWFEFWGRSFTNLKSNVVRRYYYISTIYWLEFPPWFQMSSTFCEPELKIDAEKRLRQAN